MSTILIVQGDGDLAYGLRKILQDRGYSARTALSGFEALGIVHTAQPSAILLDLDLPGLSGLKLLQRIREHAPDAKILVVTGHVKEYEHLASKMGVVDVLEKSASQEELLSRLSSLVPAASSK